MDTPLHYRQGDVLIVRCDTLPTDLKPVAREEGRIVLAHGEVTGHAHAITTPDVEMYEKDGNYYLRVPTNTLVEHEEHGPIALAPGAYRVVRQREYVPGQYVAPQISYGQLVPDRPLPSDSRRWRYVAD